MSSYRLLFTSTPSHSQTNRMHCTHFVCEKMYIELTFNEQQQQLHRRCWGYTPRQSITWKRRQFHRQYRIRAHTRTSTKHCPLLPFRLFLLLLNFLMNRKKNQIHTVALNSIETPCTWNQNTNRTKNAICDDTATNTLNSFDFCILFQKSRYFCVCVRCYAEKFFFFLLLSLEFHFLTSILSIVLLPFLLHSFRYRYTSTWLKVLFTSIFCFFQKCSFWIRGSLSFLVLLTRTRTSTLKSM